MILLFLKLIVFQKKNVVIDINFNVNILLIIIQKNLSLTFPIFNQ